MIQTHTYTQKAISPVTENRLEMSFYSFVSAILFRTKYACSRCHQLLIISINGEKWVHLDQLIFMLSRQFPPQIKVQKDRLGFIHKQPLTFICLSDTYFDLTHLLYFECLAEKKNEQTSKGFYEKASFIIISIWFEELWRRTNAINIYLKSMCINQLLT